MSGMDDVFGARSARPNHPDFWRLSEIMLKNDGRMEAASDADKEPVWQTTVSQFVDINSLSYLAVNRAIKAAGPKRLELIPVLSALFLDGFIAGCEFTKAKGESGGSHERH